MLYERASGKRVKTRKVSWVHRELKSERKTESDSFLNTEKDFRLSQCFFGEHLLTQNEETPVGIVESEKTAIVASLFLPELTWLATGGCGNLKPERLAGVIKGRRAFVFPDSSKYEVWAAKIKKANEDYSLAIRVSDLLERRLSEEQKNLDCDLADFLLMGETIKSMPED